MNIKNNEIIEVYGRKWLVLDDKYKENGVLAIQTEYTDVLPMFQKKDEMQSNESYADSYVAKYLYWLKRIYISREDNEKDYFLEYEADLVADDGSTNGKDTKLINDGMFVPSRQLYKQYYEVINRKIKIHACSGMWLSNKWSYIPIEPSVADKFNVVSNTGHVYTISAELSYAVYPVAVFDRRLLIDEGTKFEIELGVADYCTNDVLATEAAWYHLQVDNVKESICGVVRSLHNLTDVLEDKLDDIYTSLSRLNNSGGYDE